MRISAWNELGHAYRKIGDMDNSFKHHERALQINPRHKGAHEYLGEAYLQIGKLEMAEQELKAQIERYKRERTKSASMT